MTTSPLSRVVSHLRRVALLQAADRLTDAQLVETFLVGQEDAAFEALVRRHGPMVFGVCRRVLHDRHDAEDAFQATFLVFLRNARQIGKRASLASWLYGVANRTALQARKRAARRSAKERQVVDMAQKQVSADDAIQGMLPFLDQELSRLPDKYRVPIILCDLEGKTRKAAAELLNLPAKTFSSRLDRARVMLAKRLAPHGTTLSCSAVALAVSQNMASASVPHSLVASTVKSASLVVAGKTGGAAAISAKVAALTEGVVKTMLLTKLKTLTITCFIGCVLSVGLGTSIHSWQTQAAATQQPVVQKTGEGAKPGGNIHAVGANGTGQQKEAPKDFVNSIGVKFVWIPPGTFLMGSPTKEPGRRDNETQHNVTLTQGFFMGVRLVTQEQWMAVMGTVPSGNRGDQNNLPVSYVSWENCQEFLQKMEKKDGRFYRLPTEAEWEYACRAGTTTPFYSGQTISTDQANFHGSSWRNATSPVTSFPSNKWGLYDMHGNVWQWCSDWYDVYPKNDVIDQKGPENGEGRVLRGGSYRNQMSELRSACRDYAAPAFVSMLNGFRVVASSTADEKKSKTPTKTEKRSAEVMLQGVDLAKRTIKVVEGKRRVQPKKGEANLGEFWTNWELAITSTTKITIDGKEAKLAALQTVHPQQPIWVNVEWEFETLEEARDGRTLLTIFSDRARAVRVTATGFRSVGEVILSVNDNNITTRLDLNEISLQTVYYFEKNIEVVIDGKKAKPAELKPEMLVSLQLSALNKELVVAITAAGPNVTGIIRSVNAEKNTINVTIPNIHLTAQNVAVAKAAKVAINGKDAKLSDLKAGMRVTLQMSAETEDSYIVGITAEKAAKEK